MTVNEMVEGAIAPSVVPARIGGTVHTYRWTPPDPSASPITVVSETLGSGQPILLLPALSTVSSRAELYDLAHGLASRFQVTVIDWPGFGDSDRLPIAYNPALYRQFLAAFVQAHWSEAIAVVAAGHAAGYVLALEAQGLWSSITLVAPTWRGPLRSWVRLPQCAPGCGMWCDRP